MIFDAGGKSVNLFKYPQSRVDSRHKNPAHLWKKLGLKCCGGFGGGGSEE